MAQTGALSAKQERFVEAFLDSEYIEQAARLIGISDRTARRWRKLPEVLLAIEEERVARREYLRNRIDGCLNDALKITQEVLFYGANPDEIEKDGQMIYPARIDSYVALMLKFAQDRQELDAMRLRIVQLEAQVRAANEQSDESREQDRSTVVDGTVTRLPTRYAQNGG